MRKLLQSFGLGAIIKTRRQLSTCLMNDLGDLGRGYTIREVEEAGMTCANSLDVCGACQPDRIDCGGSMKQCSRGWIEPLKKAIKKISKLITCEQCYIQARLWRSDLMYDAERKVLEV